MDEKKEENPLSYSSELNSNDTKRNALKYPGYFVKDFKDDETLHKFAMQNDVNTMKLFVEKKPKRFEKQFLTV